MDKIKESLGKLLEKLKGLSRGKKIAFAVLSAGIIFGIIYTFIFLNTTKFGVLYGDMDPNNSQVVLAKLNEKKIEFKVNNNSISVPEEKIAELRMELAPLLPSGNKGYEILEDSSAFGMTDKERSQKYKMALQGELARNIESFPEVKTARVLLVMQEDSNFFREAEPSQASVTLEFNVGKNITNEQINAIVALLTGSVKNLAVEDIKVIGVINGKTAELTEELNKEKNDDFSTAIDKQQAHKKELEKEFEKKILTILSPKYGTGVKATVAVDADFDANEKKSTTFDPNKVVRSEDITKETSNAPGGNTAAGPVDNNMGNTTPVNANNIETSSEKETRNYEVGETTETTVSAPGKIKKVSASVVVNNEEITAEEKAIINNLVSAAIGYTQARGDVISIEGTKFNGEADNIAAEEAARLAQEEEAKRKKLMYTYIGAGAAALILLLIILVALRRAKRNKLEDEEQTESGIDMIIGDNVNPKEAFKPLDFEEESEKTHIEKEIKKYATQKPDQVAEIIKAWMTEEER